MVQEINDIKLIEPIASNLFKTNIKSTIYSKIIVYQDNDKLLGFCVYDLIYERCEIEYIGVLKEYRNKKIASKLLEYIINNVMKNNILNISLEVNTNNTAAIKLYEKYNFNIKAVREKYYKNGDAYLMVKEV